MAESYAHATNVLAQLERAERHYRELAESSADSDECGIWTDMAEEQAKRAEEKRAVLRALDEKLRGEDHDR